jgi:hypothetical protein
VTRRSLKFTLPVFQYTRSVAGHHANLSLLLDRIMMPLRATGSIQTALLIVG